jgi:MHS family proline/betaine transporter-like MFS transporter
MNNQVTQKKQLFTTLLLSLGTCFEFFDFMLFMQLGFILNPLFFPATITELIHFDINSFAFCLTYFFTPLGALIMGMIGDKYGRKASIILATLIMFVSCFIIAFLPTYSSIGIWATIIFLACRILQSMTSTGELVAVWVYLTETIKPPFAYLCIGFATSLAICGHGLAVIVAMLIIKFATNWRYAFWIGSLIVAIPLISRLFLVETQEFLNFKKQKCNTITSAAHNSKKVSLKQPFDNSIIHFRLKTLIATCLLHCASPIRFCLIYFYIAKVLVDKFGYTTFDLMKRNLILIFVHAAGHLISSLLSYKVCPLKLIKIKAYAFLAFVLASLYILKSECGDKSIFILQALIMLFPFDAGPSERLLLQYFPMQVRLKYFTLSFSFARMTMYFLSTILVPYAYKFFGHYVLLIFAPIIIGFIISVNYFNNLQKVN